MMTVSHYATGTKHDEFLRPIDLMLLLQFRSLSCWLTSSSRLRLGPHW